MVAHRLYRLFFVLPLLAAWTNAADTPGSCSPMLAHIGQSLSNHLPEMLEFQRGVRFLKWGIVSGLRQMDVQHACLSPGNGTLSVVLPLEGMAQVGLPGVRVLPVFFEATARASVNLTTQDGESAPRVAGLRVDKLSVTDVRHGRFLTNDVKSREFTEKLVRSIISKGLQNQLSTQLMYGTTRAIADAQPTDIKPLVLEKKVVVYQLLDRLSPSDKQNWNLGRDSITRVRFAVGP
ncbi:unnamed protein product [Ixodes persulcatus]